jgi:hypothetical protein
MGQAKQKLSVKQNGNGSAAVMSPIGAPNQSPPTSNTGGKGGIVLGGENHQSVTDRNRINISVPSGFHAALVSISEVTGMTVSQVALNCLVAGLPDMAKSAGVVNAASKGEL